MKALFCLLLSLVCVPSLAASSDPVDEIARRSGLPASEVGAVLANCDASQTSMTFCAWRDQLIAEQDLQSAVSGRETDSPACKAPLEKHVSRWSRQRDSTCEKQARKEWGTGSMRQAAQASCVTTETRRIIGKVMAFNCR
ncbi:lysozyme inhibitor LprI family protein [Paraburkholderia rhizosphaerae]|uniref:Uncharacterized protein DUF1311 n=1 Tax=Paraburkholderia rhizosphaerae TaxID=480658 RepID=A0A4R8LBH9_9BURK|nr:lysozyme inhibitor LprI family protein [Paraburkholderia rhizosphaerae]TDY40253.1 uncharacterized protein DUF1311 [Paraburkholderia rhizosphaerae]